MTILLRICRLIVGDGEVENYRLINHNKGNFMHQNSLVKLSLQNR
jgi:hypothetical protein